MYLPLEYVKRYSVLTELYCSEESVSYTHLTLPTKA